MVKIKNEQLIITIPCKSLSPLEVNGEIIEALQDAIELIDYANGSKATISNAVQKINLLLKSMAFSPKQLFTINNHVEINKELAENF